MKSILILLSPAFGHYHATYKLATQLRERGYKVVYAGEPIYKESVISLGFAFCEFSFASLVRDRYGKLRYFHFRLIPFFFSNLFKNDRRMYREYVDASEQAKQIVAAIDPALILLDIHISTLYLLIVQTGVPCFQICTTLSTARDTRIPPLTSGFVPEKKFSGSWTALLWLRWSLQSKVDYLFQKVVYAGKDNDTFLKKYAKASGIRARDFVNGKMLKAEQIPIPELVCAPKLFDYPWRGEASNVFYLGPSVLLERNGTCDDAMSELLEKLKNLKSKGSSLKVVYCSLGTINYWQNKNCLDFFRKVITAFGNQSNLIVVMAIGNDIAPQDLGYIPGNIHVFKVVPQIEVLSICDAMITHGGFNTTKECILSVVPMVVYPLSNLWDQEANAARVVYHQIGLRGKLEKDTPQIIFAKVNRLFQDPVFKSNITEMSLLFRQLNDSTTGVDRIDSFIQNAARVEHKEVV